MAYSDLVRPKKRPKTKLTKKYPDCRFDVVGYFIGPASVLPDMSGWSNIIGKDCGMISPPQ